MKSSVLPMIFVANLLSCTLMASTSQVATNDNGEVVYLVSTFGDRDYVQNTDIEFIEVEKNQFAVGKMGVPGVGEHEAFILIGSDDAEDEVSLNQYLAPIKKSKYAVFENWNHFREINLAKKGKFTKESHGDVTERDQKIISMLNKEGQEVVADHDQFRIKKLAFNWNRLLSIGQSGVEEVEYYSLPFYVRLQFYRPESSGGWSALGIEGDQGSQHVLGTIFFSVSQEKIQGLVVEFYDETNWGESLGQLLVELGSSERAAIKEDSDRLLKAAIPALQLELANDTQLMEEVLSRKSKGVDFHDPFEVDKH